MLKDFVPRLYQETILSTCVQKNTLVVLPTGLGKTGIALLMTAQRLKNYPTSKILFLAPTKPLAEQHLQTFKQNLEINDDKLVLFTGEVPPEKRAILWKNAQIVFSTPQGLENDVINNAVNLSEVSLLIFDEAHRATGDYAYVFLAKQYNKKANNPRILALTASPGSDLQTIEDVCKNLHIEDVEIRTEEDPDVQPYVQEMEINTRKVELPEDFRHIIK
ncbi:DEAD/DEAH box helicase, partial [Candidatus Woesearchaeota archaeon]|nr:DEAD/DEAH box helicase [Candidatus Woesearchaeota archaeon]